MNKQDLKKIREEQLLEGVYHNIGSLYIESTLDEMENIEKHECPARLDAWFHGYLEEIKRKEKRKKYKRYFKRQLQRVAIVFIALTIGFTSLMIGVEAFRVEVMRMFFDIQDQYTSIHFKEADILQSDLLEDWEYYYYPKYIPKGYELIGADGAEGLIKVLHFKNAEEKRLMFLQSPMPMESTLDTENVIVENIKVLGLDGFYIKKKEFGILLWHDDEIVFQIAGWFTKKDLFKIAESIEFVR